MFATAGRAAAIVLALVVAGRAARCRADSLYSVLDLGPTSRNTIDDLNDRGQVLLHRDRALAPAPIWAQWKKSALIYNSLTDGSVVDIGTLGGGDYDTDVSQGINNAGQVAGMSSFGQYGRPTLYADGQVADFGITGGRVFSIAGINNSGQIAGAISQTGGPGLGIRAFLYDHGQMTIYDLPNPEIQ